jgi:hypothetical protein
MMLFLHEKQLLIICSAVAIAVLCYGQSYKTFYGHNLQIFEISHSVFPCKPSQPSLMFAGKAGAYQSKESTVQVLLNLPANIGLGWKGLPAPNTLAYYINP